jgi:hypothetical protein
MSSQETEPVPENPYSCPGCGADLHERGAVLAWIDYPDEMVGHIEPGEEEGINVVIDSVESLPIRLLCEDCGEELEGLHIEDWYLGHECVIKSESEEIGKDKEGVGEEFYFHPRARP